MRKLFVLGAILVLILIGPMVPGCGTPEETLPGEVGAEEVDGPGVTENSIKLGTWLPLSGPATTYGLQLREGLEAYFELINNKGGINGRKIELVIENVERDPERTLAAARKMVEHEEVFAIVGAFGVAQSEATFSYLLDEQEVPIFGLFASKAEWYDPPRANLFGTFPLYEKQAQALAQWMVNEGAEKIIVVHAEPKSHVNVAHNYEIGAKAINPDVSVDYMPVKQGTMDYTPIAMQVINADPDAIGFVGDINELSYLAKELDRQGKRFPIYSYSPSINKDIIELGGKNVEGLRGVSVTFPVFADNPEIEEFRETLKKRNTEDIMCFNTLFAWGTAKTFVEALSRVDGPLTRKRFIEALYTLNEWESGIFPSITFNKNRHLGPKGIQPVELKEGEFQIVGDFFEPITK